MVAEIIKKFHSYKKDNYVLEADGNFIIARDIFVFAALCHTFASSFYFD